MNRVGFLDIGMYDTGIGWGADGWLVIVGNGMGGFTV